MKIKYYLITASIIFLTFLISCESPAENRYENNLYGSWQLRIISGGYAGISDTLDIAKNNYLLVFNKNKEFFHYYNDTLSIKGSYRVTKEKTIFSQDSLDVINYYNYNSDQNIEKEVVLHLSEDALYLSDNAVDSFEKFYTKVK